MFILASKGHGWSTLMLGCRGLGLGGTILVSNLVDGDQAAGRYGGTPVFARRHIKELFPHLGNSTADNFIGTAPGSRRPLLRRDVTDCEYRCAVKSLSIVAVIVYKDEETFRISTLTDG